MNPASPVLQSRERPASRIHGRDALGWLIPLSLALHLALVASLLTLSSAPRLPDEAEALSVEFIAGAEPPGAAPQPLVPAETSPAPIASPIPVQQADATPPSPAPPPLPTPSSAQAPDIAVPLPMPPAVPGPEAPLPPPAATPAATAAPPDVPVPPPVPVAAPPSPTQQAELPLPAERPLPTPPLPPPAPPLPQVAQALPPPPRPQASRPALPRPAPPRPAPSPGAGTALASAAQIAASQVAASQAAAQAAASQAAASRASAAANGSAWLGRLKQWWDGHSFYPREASQADEGGAVRVRIAIAPDGQVTFIQVVGSSGSPVLDAAALAVFRGARLPPLSEAVAGPAEVVVTLHYRPAGGG